MLPGLEVIMIFCHHPTLAFILAPNQRTLGQLNHRILVWQLDLGVLFLYISFYYYHIIYLYISTQKPNQKQYDVYIYIIYIYRCYKHYTLIFIPKSIYFKTLVYIYILIQLQNMTLHGLLRSQILMLNFIALIHKWIPHNGNHSTSLWGNFIGPNNIFKQINPLNLYHT